MSDKIDSPSSPSLIITGAFSCDKVSVITFSFLKRWLPNRCKEQQKSFSNNMKYSDFIDGKYFLRNKPLKGPHCSKKMASSRKIC